MTDPAGGAPTPPPPSGNWQAPPPPAGGTPPPPSAGSWQAPPPTSGPTFQQSTVEPGPAPGITYADTVTRIIALVIDAVIIGIIGFFISTFVGIIFSAATGIGILFLFVGGLVSAAISVVYFVYGWTRMRASFGQKFLNLETVNAADGATLTQNQAIRRWAFLWGPQAVIGIVPFLALFAWPLEFLYGIYLLYTVTQSTKRQGFHDVQSGTVVVKRG